MDILIMVLLVGVGLLVMRSGRRWLIVSLWVVTLILLLGLFRLHVTDPLPLQF